MSRYCGCIAYRVEDPGCSVPSRRVESCPEVEEEHRSDTTAIDVWLGVFRWLRYLDISTNDPHTNGAAERANQKKIAAANAVNEPKKPEPCYDKFDDSEDTSREKTRVGPSDTDALKSC